MSRMRMKEISKWPANPWAGVARAERSARFEGCASATVSPMVPPDRWAGDGEML
ncbi:MAG: hypothetical protein NXI18_18400 [Alphaproteobacteria bacterium]|nr:hypothetical protein [Alphaproteobacteria bacterium]